MSSKKLGHAKSLRRRCFNLHHLDSQTEPADQAVSSTVTVHSPALSVEDTDLTEMPSKRERKSGSGTVDSSPGESGSFLGCRTQYQAAIRPSQSSSSLDSGLGLSRASSISSLPHSQRPSRESSNLADTASPLVESKRLVSVDELQSETLENDDLINKEDRKVMADKSGSVNSGILTDGEDKPNCDNNNEDDLVGRMKRFSISAVILDRLVTAVREVVADVTPHTAAAGIPKHTHLHASYSEPLTERDSPCRAPVRRHSSAGPYIPLTQGPKGQAERKRSAQPSFHRSFCNNKLEDDSESSSGKVRKTSACIMCRRKQRESTRSEPRVYIKTTPTIPGHQKKRRFSEIFKVFAPHA